MESLKVYYHKGYAEGSNTIILMIPEKELILIILSNNKRLEMNYIVNEVLLSQLGFEVTLSN